jgi:hypothetical protein
MIQILAAFLGLLVPAQGVPQPRLEAVFPPGGRTGTEIELKLASGSDIDRCERLIFSHPGIQAEPLREAAGPVYPQGRLVPGSFRVAIGKDVPPGVYEVRAAGYFGISNARRFAVGTDPEISEKEPNNDAATAQEIPAGTVVNGTLDAQGFDAYRVKAAKGTRLIAECRALDLDSRARPVLILLDAAGREVRRVIANKFRDPLLDVRIEEDGVYTFLLHDLLYQGGAEFGYRFSAGPRPWLDFAEPAVLKPGAENAVTLYGRNLPGAEPAGIEIDGRPLEKLAVKIAVPASPGPGHLGTPQRPADASADLYSWGLPGSNALRFALGDEPLVLETEPNDEPGQANAVSPPVQFSGRFQAPGDRDWVSFQAKQGEKLWIEVVAQRLGHPVDPQIVVQQVLKDGQTKDLVDVDDQPLPLPAMSGNMERRYRAQPEDPGVAFTPPADGTYRVLLRDLFGSAQGDPRHVYRLSIRPARPDFRLLALPIDKTPADNKFTPVTCTLRRGGADVVRVVAFRLEGFDGPIRIEAGDLPPGVTARPAQIPPGESAVDLVLQAAPDAPAFAGGVQIHGWADLEGRPVGRLARGVEALYGVGDMQKDALVTRLTEQLALAVDPHHVDPLAIRVPDVPLRASRAGKVKVPVELLKQADAKDLDKAQIKVALQGVPGKKNDKLVSAKEVVLTVAKPREEIEIEFSEKLPAGRYSLTFTGLLEIAYQRAPELLKEAQEEQKRVDALAAELAGTAKKAGEERKQAELALQKAKGAKTEAAAIQAAEEELARAAESDKQASEAAQAAEALRKPLADAVKKLGDAAKEKKIKIWLSSPPLDVEIAASPVEILPANPLVLKAGEKADLGVELRREFGCADEVQIELSAPKESGLKAAQALKVAGGASQGLLQISADKGAKPGTYRAVLKAKLTYNGKALGAEREVELKVE